MTATCPSCGGLIGEARTMRDAAEAAVAAGHQVQQGLAPWEHLAAALGTLGQALAKKAEPLENVRAPEFGVPQFVGMNATDPEEAAKQASPRGFAPEGNASNA